MFIQLCCVLNVYNNNICLEIIERHLLKVFSASFIFADIDAGAYKCGVSARFRFGASPFFAMCFVAGTSEMLVDVASVKCNSEVCSVICSIYMPIKPYCNGIFLALTVAERTISLDIKESC